NLLSVSGFPGNLNIITGFGFPITGNRCNPPDTLDLQPVSISQFIIDHHHSISAFFTFSY
ncbi:MAG TPA: hypothetical protein VF008_30890, partial [Niastella sp.]